MSKKSENNSVMVHKVVLSSGKEILLREMKIKYQRLAMQAVGKRGDGNTALLSTMAIEELTRILLVQINGQDVDQKEKEDLDGLFSFAEYRQVSEAVGKLMGAGDELGELQMESVFTGSK